MQIVMERFLTWIVFRLDGWRGLCHPSAKWSTLRAVLRVFTNFLDVLHAIQRKVSGIKLLFSWHYNGFERVRTHMG